MSSDNSNLQNERPKRPCEFTFTWSIHNYSSWAGEENEYFESPEFVVDLDEKTKWKVWIYPRGYSTPGFLGCYLDYIEPQPALDLISDYIMQAAVQQTVAKNVHFILSVRKSNGQFEEGVESIFNHSVITNGSDKLVPLENFKCPDSYLVNDTLTVRFRMWGMESKNPVSGECRIHSRMKENVPETLVYQTVLNKLQQVHPHKDLNKVWTKNMQQCYKNKKFSDFVIQTPRQEFPVHRSVLAAHSEVFQAMFERDMKERKSGTVNIDDVEDEIVSKMLMYIYTNTFDDIEISSAFKLYAAADKYGITALQKKCSNFLMVGLQASNACDVLELADTCQDQELKAGTRDFIHAYAKDVMNSEGWKKLKQTNVDLICETTEWMICNRFLK